MHLFQMSLSKQWRRITYEVLNLSWSGIVKTNTPCILTDEKEMLAFWGRKVYRMEKVVDYDDIVEGKDFRRLQEWGHPA